MTTAALISKNAMIEESTLAVMLAESLAVIQALRNTQVLDISSESADRLAAAMALYAYKAIGV